MEHYYRCDSCQKLFPESLIKSCKFSYNKMDGAAKNDISKETMYGFICVNCAQEQPMTTSKKTTTSKKSYSK
jgi:rubredoxin